MFGVTLHAAEVNTSFSKEQWKFWRWGSYLSAEMIASIALEFAKMMGGWWEVSERWNMACCERIREMQALKGGGWHPWRGGGCCWTSFGIPIAAGYVLLWFCQGEEEWGSPVAQCLPKPSLSHVWQHWSDPSFYSRAFKRCGRTRAWLSQGGSAGDRAASMKGGRGGGGRGFIVQAGRGVRGFLSIYWNWWRIFRDSSIIVDGIWNERKA